MQTHTHTYPYKHEHALMCKDMNTETQHIQAYMHSHTTPHSTYINTHMQTHSHEPRHICTCVLTSTPMYTVVSIPQILYLIAL